MAVWRGEGPYNGEIISSPVYGDGVVFLQLWRQSPIHAIRLNGDGKPPAAFGSARTPARWSPSLLYYRGLLYALKDNGVLTCLDGKTGAERYRERLGDNCNSSPIAGDGKIYLSKQRRPRRLSCGRATKSSGCNQRTRERITASPRSRAAT